MKNKKLLMKNRENMEDRIFYNQLKEKSSYNEYILLDEGKSCYDPDRKIYSAAAPGDEVDIVYLKERFTTKHFVEHKSVFNQQYKELTNE